MSSKADTKAGAKDSAAKKAVEETQANTPDAETVEEQKPSLAQNTTDRIIRDSVGSFPHVYEPKTLTYTDWSSGEGVERNYRVVRAGNIHTSQILAILTLGGWPAFEEIGVDVTIFFEPPPNDPEEAGILARAQEEASLIVESRIGIIVGYLIASNSKQIYDFVASCIKTEDGKKVDPLLLQDGDYFPPDSAVEIMVSFFTTNDTQAFLSSMMRHFEGLSQQVKLKRPKA